MITRRGRKVEQWRGYPQPSLNSQISSIKILPGRNIYALSYSTARLFVFDAAGSPVRTIDLLEHRPVDGRFYFFDFVIRYLI